MTGSPPCKETGAACFHCLGALHQQRAGREMRVGNRPTCLHTWQGGRDPLKKHSSGGQNILMRQSELPGKSKNMSKPTLWDTVSWQGTYNDFAGGN